MDWSVSILSTTSSDTEPTAIVTFDNGKYIFNAGENTNRAFLQSRRNWRKTRCLFFTSVGTKRASGLPGLLMSFADATIPKLNVAGPPGLTHYMASMRLYTYRDTMFLNAIEAPASLSFASPKPMFQDENVTVYSFPVIPIPQSSIVETQVLDGVSSENTVQDSKRKREPSPNSSRKRQDSVGLQQSSNKTSTLDEYLKVPKFSPNHLYGRLAHEYRELVLRTMFPGFKVPLTLPSHKAGKKSNYGKNRIEAIPEQVVEDVAVTSDFQTDTYKRPSLPRGFYQQLPSFVQPYPHSVSDHSARPTLAYVLVGPRIRGKFDVAKAEELGVPFGRLRGQLTKGQSVVFKVKVGDEEIERTVKPEECVGESEAPGVVLVLDTPTNAHIPSLLTSFTDSPFFSKLRSKKLEDMKEYAVRCVLHLCGDGVLEDDRYKAFMNGFGPLVNHIVASREHCSDPVTFTSAAFSQLRLNQLDSELFPLPKLRLTPLKDIRSVPYLPAQTIAMSSNISMRMRPYSPPAPDPTIDELDPFHTTIKAGTDLALPITTFDRFSEAKATVAKPSTKTRGSAMKGSEVKIIPLGTGSALPSKYRNVSSTLVQIPNWGNILLDAGEGTWGQLVRQFGLDEPNNVWQFLRQLKCIYISHIHGDHHMGVAKILAQRKLLDPPPSEPLYLVAIRGVHLYLRELSELEDLGLNDTSGNGVVTVLSDALHWRNAGNWQYGNDEPWLDAQRSKGAARRMCKSLGLTDFKTVNVIHRTRCYGAVLKHSDGWSIVFSGDTQPTESLVQAGQGATLLIHEATMADDQVEMAERKAHSTFEQALDIGRRMNAENILLTHFSARYPKMPPGLTKPDNNDCLKANEPVVGLAFDHLNVTIGNMWKLNRYMAAIEQSFKDTVEEGEDENTSRVMEVDVP